MMKLASYFNDTFNHGPEGHPMSSAEWEITPDRLRDILRNHSASRGVVETAIWLRGPNYPGYAIHGVPAALLDELGVPPLNQGERNPG